MAVMHEVDVVERWPLLEVLLCSIRLRKIFLYIEQIIATPEQLRPANVCKNLIWNKLPWCVKLLF